MRKLNGHSSENAKYRATAAHDVAPPRAARTRDTSAGSARAPRRRFFSARVGRVVEEELIGLAGPARIDVQILAAEPAVQVSGAGADHRRLAAAVDVIERPA